MYWRYDIFGDSRGMKPRKKPLTKEQVQETIRVMEAIRDAGPGEGVAVSDWFMKHGIVDMLLGAEGKQMKKRGRAIEPVAIPIDSGAACVMVRGVRPNFEKGSGESVLVEKLTHGDGNHYFEVNQRELRALIAALQKHVRKPARKRGRKK